jgi:hypothetical protein
MGSKDDEILWFTVLQLEVLCLFGPGISMVWKFRVYRLVSLFTMESQSWHKPLSEANDAQGLMQWRYCFDLLDCVYEARKNSRMNLRGS